MTDRRQPGFRRRASGNADACAPPQEPEAHRSDAAPSDLSHKPADVPCSQPFRGIHNDVHGYRVGLAIHRQHRPVHALWPAADRDADVPSHGAVGQGVADRPEQREVVVDGQGRTRIAGRSTIHGRTP
jgi:hypothetical protein